MVLSNHLLFEYEEVGQRYAAEMGLTSEDIDDVLDALFAAGDSVNFSPLGFLASAIRTMSRCCKLPWRKAVRPGRASSWASAPNTAATPTR